jgi:REP element-mobilizing transposase RayT
MRSARQFFFPGFEGLKAKEFGGALIKGNPREARPVSSKRPMHLVMRSTLARGDRSFLRFGRAKQIKSLVERVSRSHGVKLYRYANGGNHLHMIVLPKSREGFNGFIRAITGLIARLTLGVERGRAKGLKFWDARPFTRVLEWGKDYTQVCQYLLQNTLEALGFIPYKPRNVKNGGRNAKKNIGKKGGKGNVRAAPQAPPGAK